MYKYNKIIDTISAIDSPLELVNALSEYNITVSDRVETVIKNDRFFDDIKNSVSMVVSHLNDTKALGKKEYLLELGLTDDAFSELKRMLPFYGEKWQVFSVTFPTEAETILNIVTVSSTYDMAKQNEEAKLDQYIAKVGLGEIVKEAEKLEQKKDNEE